EWTNIFVDNSKGNYKLNVESSGDANTISEADGPATCAIGRGSQSRSSINSYEPRDFSETGTDEPTWKHFAPIYLKLLEPLAYLFSRNYNPDDAKKLASNAERFYRDSSVR